MNTQTPEKLETKKTLHHAHSVALQLFSAHLKDEKIDLYQLIEHTKRQINRIEKNQARLQNPYGLLTFLRQSFNFILGKGGKLEVQINTLEHEKQTILQKLYTKTLQFEDMASTTKHYAEMTAQEFREKSRITQNRESKETPIKKSIGEEENPIEAGDDSKKPGK